MSLSRIADRAAARSASSSRRGAGCVRRRRGSQSGLAWQLVYAANTMLIPGTQRPRDPLAENPAAGDLILDPT